MKRLYILLATLVLVCTTHTNLKAQFIGIGTDFPIASLDIRTSNIISSIYIERIAGATTGVGAVKIEDNGDWVGMELYEYNDAALVASYVYNEGLGNALWATSVDAANSTWTGRFTNAGQGAAILSSITTAAGTAPSLDVYQGGLNDGIQVFMDNSLNLGVNAEDGIQVRHLGDNGYGIFTDVYSFSQTMLNFIEEGIGIENVHFDDGSTSFTSDMRGFDGDGYFFSNNKTSAPVGGGDGFGYIGLVNTQTPSIIPTLEGAVLVGVQYGNGWGMLLNHVGVQGRNAEFNVTNTANTDAAIFSVHNGGGNSLVAQNQSLVPIAGIVEVLDASYLGNDIDDHVAIDGFSSPMANFGYGVRGYGGYIGVNGEADPGGLAGIFSAGDFGAFGTKAFIIDHPLDPANKMLKHFALESNEVLNVYQGTIQLNTSGKAVVTLPDYFHAININYNYQLTSIGTNVQAWIYKEIQDGKFMIAGKPKSKVSWMVVANRNDAYIQKNPDRIKNTVAKRDKDLGKYLDPRSHDKQMTSGVFYREDKKQTPAKVDKSINSNGRSVAETSSKERKSTVNTSPPEAAKNKLPPRELPTREAIQKMNLKMQIKTWDELGIE